MEAGRPHPGRTPTSSSPGAVRASGLAASELGRRIIPTRSTADDLERLYANRFSVAEREARRRLWATLCESFLNRYISGGDTVLDIGPGHCDFINHVTAARRIGVDLNPATVLHAAPGVEVYRVPFLQIGEVLAAGSVDLALASNVFEHLRSPEELLEVLAGIHRVLKPGGRIIVLQPNIRAVGAAFWDFLDHTLPLTEKGMEEALRMSGLEVVERRARFLPYTTKSFLPKSSLLLRIYLKIRPLQWLFGKQMFLMARRTR